jgi:hypothetical protein
MKKTIILTILGFILVVSCDEWLYLEPEEGVIREEYWQSEDDVFAAMMGCYASLLGNAIGGSGYSIPDLIFLWGEIRGDLAVPYRNKTEFRNIYYGDILADNPVCRWNTYYQSINFCNTVLKFAPDVLERDPSFSEDQLKIYESEALALRALLYFYLVRSFGEVPLKLTATVSDEENFAIPKSSSTVVLNQIKADLRKAEKNAPYTYGDNDSDKGRITKFAVYAIQADVYLWCEQYDSCLIACNKITDSGKFGLVQSDKNWFSTLYATGNSSESIFELQFSKTRYNPLYDMHGTDRYFRASPGAMEIIFPYDYNVIEDSADVRADKGSYHSSYNYMIWKYVGKNSDEQKIYLESYTHLIIYKYSEILLTKAEALNQLNRMDEALVLVNRIRRRARASDITDMATGQTLTKNTMADYILEERARELAFEGKRWYDVLRNARRNHYERLQILVNMVVSSSPGEKQVTIKNKMLDTLYHYWPIYKDELETNAALVQNAFYED